MAAYKPDILISQLLDKIETKFQRLTLHFRGPATQWDWLDNCATKPEVENRGYINVSGVQPAILDFRLPLMSGGIQNNSIVLLDPENVGIAVEIAFLSSRQAEL